MGSKRSKLEGQEARSVRPVLSREVARAILERHGKEATDDELDGWCRVAENLAHAALQEWKRERRNLEPVDHDDA